MSGFKGRPFLGWCSHQAEMSTVTAGLERVVCERCGRVRLRYLGSTVKVYPDLEDPGTSDSSVELPTECQVCGEKATFRIPNGVACLRHAWAEATRQSDLGFDLWAPIRIDQNANTSG